MFLHSISTTTLFTTSNTFILPLSKIWRLFQADTKPARFYVSANFFIVSTIFINPIILLHIQSIYFMLPYFPALVQEDRRPSRLPVICQCLSLLFYIPNVYGFSCVPEPPVIWIPDFRETTGRTPKQ